MNKIKIELIDEKGFVIDKFELMNSDNFAKYLAITIGKKQIFYKTNGNLIMTADVNNDVINRLVGKKIDNELIDDSFIYSVRYSDPTRGWKGECVYYMVKAKSNDEAKKLAMGNKEFISKIDMKHFDNKYLSAYVPKHYDKNEIGKVSYFEGDERL